MANLYQCALCKSPFVADEDAVMQHSGRCITCVKRALLQSWGLAADFLERAWI